MITINTLNTYPLGKLCGINVKCGCGAEHTVETRDIAVGAGALDALPKMIENLIGPLIKVCIVSDKTCFNAAGQAAEKLLLTHGFKCCRRIYDDNTAESVENSDALLQIDEDVKALAAVGGGKIFDMAKYAAVKLKLPCFGVMTSLSSDSCLSPFAMLYNKGFKEIYVTKPPLGLVADTNVITGGGEALTAAGYGLIMSKRIALLDWRFSARLTGEKYCRDIAEQAAAGIAQAEKLSDALMSGGKSAVCALTEILLRLSLLSQLLKSSRLSNGGETHVCHTLEALLSAGNRQARLYGENLFLSAAFLSKVYCAFLKEELTDFIPPPDLSLRAEKMAELLAVPETGALARIKPYMPAETYRLTGHKFKEYRGDFLAEAVRTRQSMENSMKVFKRLYSDAGYWMTNYPEEPDWKTALALAPDYREKYTALAYMRDLGLLDKYLM